MMMDMYIKGKGMISAQETFTDIGFPDKVIDYTDVSSLRCIEPAYRNYIDPMAGRRMSRLVKMGVCAALKCMNESGVTMPDAIITGTGLGCIEDTEKFLGSMILNEERQLNPTPFIQSTHNTIASAIAIAIKCHGYNSTYVHRGFSFENALMDSRMFLEENPGANVLVGGLDEATTNSLNILRRFGLLKLHPVNNLTLLEYNTEGTLAGEGVSFFMLSSDPQGCTSRICAFETHFNPANIEKKLADFLGFGTAEQAHPDLIIAGFNGDRMTDKITHRLLGNIPGGAELAFYKHLCGEYDTSVSFALWLADYIISHNRVPENIKFESYNLESVNKILIYNNYRNTHHSMMMVAKI
jgi:3-oxoacyl-[acyl-carrier-protein] synthase II